MGRSSPPAGTALSWSILTLALTRWLGVRPGGCVGGSVGGQLGGMLDARFGRTNDTRYL